MAMGVPISAIDKNHLTGPTSLNVWNQALQLLQHILAWSFDRIHILIESLKIRFHTSDLDQNYKSSVDFFSQLPTTLKHDHPPIRQHQIITRSWIPSPRLLLFIHTEFAQSGNKDIIARFQLRLDEFNAGFRDFK